MSGTRVLLRSPFSPWTGYGRDGLSLARGLAARGWAVDLRPTSVESPLPVEVALMLTRTIEPPYDMFLCHTDPRAMHATDGEQKSGRLRVGWTMWEFTGLPAQEKWVRKKSRLRASLDKFDVIVGYDDVTLQALRPYLRDDMETRVVQGGYDSSEWLAPAPDIPARDWDSTFRFAMVGMLHQRKNPWAAIRAFKSLKDEHGDAFDAELHLKTLIRAFHPKMEEWCPGLRIHYESWPQPKMLRFYHGIHCLLAPSWGEGKNLPALEALTTGATAILSRFGGHTQWGDEDYLYFVDGPVEEHVPGMGSMRVDEAQLRDLMWHVYTHRSEAREKGELARRTVPAMMDWANVIERLLVSVKDVTPRWPIPQM